MAPADCVQKSALIIQLQFLLFMRVRVSREQGELLLLLLCRRRRRRFSVHTQPHTHSEGLMSSPLILNLLKSRRWFVELLHFS